MINFILLAIENHVCFTCGMPSGFAECESCALGSLFDSNSLEDISECYAQHEKIPSDSGESRGD